MKNVNNSLSIDSQEESHTVQENVNENRELPRRVLPKLSSNLKQNSVDQLEMSEKFRMANNTTQLIKELSESNANCNQNENNSAYLNSTTLPSNRKSLRQSLIKQASLNNPNYYQHLNNDFFQDESSLYENSTSNQELRKTTSTSYLVKNANKPAAKPSPSMHISRSSLHNASLKKERLQDPALMFKNRNSSANSNSRLNISSLDAEVDESTLYSREKSLNMISLQQQTPRNDIHDINKENDHIPKELNSLNELNQSNLVMSNDKKSNKIANSNETAINQTFR